jgi:dimethylglycine catabolism A
MDYKLLFSPITINGMTLKNRIVMSPGGNGASGGHEYDYMSAPQIDFLLRRARGGVGLIYVGVIGGDISDRVVAPRLSHDRYIPRFQKTVEQIHETGAKVCVQFAITFEVPPGVSGKQTPEDIPVEDMKRAMDATASAARRARNAGADAVELKCCHSTIIPAFLSRHWNRRKDEYGGNTEGRMKYPLEIYLAMRQLVGGDFPVGIRLGADDFLPDGNTLTHTRVIAKKFAEMGIDYLSHSAGFIGERDSKGVRPFPTSKYDDNAGIPYCAYRVQPVEWMPDGTNVYLGEDLRNTLREAGYSIPVITAGKISNPKFAEDILQEERADLIGLCRPLMRDPDWAIKARESRVKEIKRCLFCNQCMVHKRGEPALCIYNKM